MQLEKIKPSKADCVFRSFRRGDHFPIQKKNFEGENGGVQKSMFFGVSASSTGELELSDFVAHGSALNEPGAERWRKVAAQLGGRLQMQLGQAASPGGFSSTEAKQDFVQRGTKNREKCRVCPLVI